MQQCCNKELSLNSENKKNFKMKVSINFLLVFTVVAATVLFSGCKDDPEPEPPNEEEVITTLKYTLSPSAGGTDIELSFTDLDGEGAGVPVIVGGTLMANTDYVGSLELLNESESPAEDITVEIMEEDEEHQFFFESSISDLTVLYSDTDADGNPVGLETSISTGSAATGTLSIVLKHEPDKSGTGVSGGDITNAGGETDIEVSFPINVQ